ncbi:MULTISPECIES: HemK2/MTQ2 family protein methyltransferase [Salinibaculum]|uniref:HemK2/MTQ2 family protein methyltransferase n=1 Tax=Salinibaculum TaxID=2732368 RepID=UPI0030D1720E
MPGDRPALADRRDLKTVYQPAEDSKLLADAAVPYVDAGDWVLDVGTGSGYVAHRFLEETDARVVGSDINPNACRQARNAGIPVVRADQLTPFRDGAFDVVVFNPPYLPTAPDREWNDWMEKALSGGETGREVIEPFLDDLRRVLDTGGDAFLLVSSLTGIDAVREHARASGLTTMEVAEEPQPYERLVVLHLRPSGGPDAVR